jgi:site-specific recombinase XerD
MRIYSRPRKGSRERSWYIDYRDPNNGRRIRKVCGKTRREAEAYRVKIEGKLFRTGSSTFVSDNPPFYEFMQDYVEHLEATGITSSSLKRYKQILQNFVNFVFYEKSNVKSLGDITTKDIWDFIHYRKKKGIKDKTISNEIGEIKKCFRYAVEIGAIALNPAQAVKFRMGNESTPHFFTKEEIKKIFKELPEDWMRDIFRTLLYTGMRKGELMHFQWKDVDFERRLIHIRHQVIKGGKIIYKTKTKSSARSIPMYEEVYEILQKQKKRGLNKDYVFVNSKGRAFRDDDLYHYLKPRLIRLGIKGSIHTFRHTYATLLIEAGVGLRELKELMGHSKIDTTMQYAHLYPHRLHEQVNRLKELSIDTMG